MGGHVLRMLPFSRLQVLPVPGFREPALFLVTPFQVDLGVFDDGPRTGSDRGAATIPGFGRRERGRSFQVIPVAGGPGRTGYAASFVRTGLRLHGDKPVRSPETESGESVCAGL